MPLAHRSLSPEHEKMLWDKKVLNMETSKGLSRSVIFYLIKCFALWQGKELRQLETSHVTFGEDDLGSFVALDLQNTTSFKQKKLTKRYDDPANPRSVYKIMKKYRSYVANEGPFLVRPISSIKDFVCYSPLPLGVNVIESAVSTLMKEAGLGISYVNYSLNLQAVDTLLRFGTGSHCLASWLFKNGLKGMPPAPVCGPTNCEDSNREMSLMMSRLLDAPYPLDAMEIIQKMEQMETEEGNPPTSPAEKFDSWMSNLMSRKKIKDILSRGKLIEESDDGGHNDLEDDGQQQSNACREEDSNVSVVQSKTCTSKKLFSKSHSVSSHSAKNSKRKNCEFKISSVSSISEGAFTMQKDESSAPGTNTPKFSKKRKKLSTHTLPSQVKRVKKFPQRSKDTETQDSGDSHCIKQEVDGDSCENGTQNDSTLQDGENGSVINCGDEDFSLSQEIKLEIAEDVSESERGSNTDSFSKVPSVFSDETNNETQNDVQSSHDKIESVDDPQQKERTRDGKEFHETPENKESIDSSLETLDHVKEEEPSPSESDESKTTREMPGEFSSNLCEESESPNTKAQDEQSLGMQKLEKKMRDRIAVLRELRQSSNVNLTAVSRGKKADNSVSNSMSCGVACSTKDKTEPSLGPSEPAVAGAIGEMPEQEEEEEDLTADLSPPVLSPQVPVSAMDVSDGEMEGDEDEWGSVKSMSDVASLIRNRSAQKSFFSSTSTDIMQFLDKANKHIKDLLKGTGESHSDKMMGSSDCCDRSKLTTDSSFSVLSSDYLKPKTTSSSCVNAKTADKSTALSEKATNPEPNMTPPTSSCDDIALLPTQTQTHPKHSILRSFLEKPKEFLPTTKSLFITKNSSLNKSSSLSSSLSSSTTLSSSTAVPSTSSSSSSSSPSASIVALLKKSTSSSLLPLLSLSSTTTTTTSTTSTSASSLPSSSATRAKGNTCLLPLPTQSTPVPGGNLTQESGQKGIVQPQTTTATKKPLNVSIAQLSGKSSMCFSSSPKPSTICIDVLDSQKPAKSFVDISTSQKATKSCVDVSSPMKGRKTIIGLSNSPKPAKSYTDVSRQDKASLTSLNDDTRSLQPPAGNNKDKITSGKGAESSAEGHNIQEQHQRDQSKTDDSTSKLSQLPVKVIIHNSVSSSSRVTVDLNTPLSSGLCSIPTMPHSASPCSSLVGQTSLLSSSSTLPSLLPTASSPPSPEENITTPAVPESNLGSAVFKATQDLTVNTIFQTLQVSERTDSEDGVWTHNFADIPCTTSPPPRSKCRPSRPSYARTSEINLGDYFPAGMLIPASSIRISTQQGPNGSEVLLSFGVRQPTSSVVHGNPRP